MNPVGLTTCWSFPVPISLEAILASERLPSLPEVAARIVEIARSPEPDFDKMIDAIRTDPAMAGRILKTANSALLGMRTRASSIETAVPRLGSTMVRTLVLSFCLAEYQNKNSFNLRPWYQQIWRESLIQAATAELLAERQGKQIDPANWFLAGLVQDIGRLALLHTCGEEYVEKVLDVDDERSQRDREHAWLGFTHVEVGFGLCCRWNLDREILDAIAVHHAAAHRIVPLKFVSSVSLPAALITAGHVADYIAEVGHSLRCSREHIERLLMQVFAMRPNEVFRMLADVDQRVSEFSAVFGIDVGRPPELEPILADAQRMLSEIAITSQLRLVNAHVSVGHAERIRMAAEEQVESLQDTAWRDHLTGAFNRAWLGTALEAIIKQSHTQNTSIGLMFVDIDQFKAINDTEGHAAGDLLLQKVTDILKDCVRLTDSVVRYGGDEFVITLRDVNADMLTLIADQIVGRIRSELSSSEPERSVTCSLGAVLYDPMDSKVMRQETLIKEADRAMYEAKRRGGNRASFEGIKTEKKELVTA